MHADIAVNVSDGQFPGGTTGASEISGARRGSRSLHVISRRLTSPRTRQEEINEAKKRKTRRGLERRRPAFLAAVMLVLERARARRTSWRERNREGKPPATLEMTR
jgi:hypothetical protein